MGVKPAKNMPIGVYERTEKQKEFLREISKRPRCTRIIPDKLCPVCHKIFRPESLLIKYCSRVCFSKNRPHKGIIKKCKICGKEFYVHSYEITLSKYCSNKCREKSYLKGKNRKCKNCGEKYHTPPAQIKWRGSSFCSMACAKDYRKNKYYEGKRKNKKLNQVLKKQLWGVFSEYIRQRDDGVCISCGKKDFWRKMDAGHYIPKTAGLTLYFDERNVNCQCTHCNRWMHGNLSDYAIALRRKYGEKILEELDAEKHTLKKIKNEEYKMLIEKYKTKTQELSRNKL